MRLESFESFSSDIKQEYHNRIIELKYDCSDEKNVYHKISYSYSCISRYSQFFCEPKKS